MTNHRSKLQQGLIGSPSVIFWSFSIFSQLRQYVKYLLQEVKTASICDINKSAVVNSEDKDLTEFSLQENG